MPESPLQLDVDHSDCAVCLTLHTDMLGPEGAREVTQAVERVMDIPADVAAPSLIRLDLAGVTLMASAAIGAVIVLHKRLAARQCRLELIDPTHAVREALEFLKLDRILTISAAT